MEAFREDFQSYAAGNAIRPLDLRQNFGFAGLLVFFGVFFSGFLVFFLWFIGLLLWVFEAVFEGLLRVWVCLLLTILFCVGLLFLCCYVLFFLRGAFLALLIFTI